MSAKYETLEIDGLQYSMADLSEETKQIIMEIQSVDGAITRNAIEQISLQGSRIALLTALKNRLPKAIEPVVE